MGMVEIMMVFGMSLLILSGLQGIAEALNNVADAIRRNKK